MRYYLDTNILAFILFYKDKEDNLDNNTSSILTDYENIFYVSSVVIRELLLLYKEGDFSSVKFNVYKDYKALFKAIEETCIEIKPITKQHLFSYAELVPATKHKDPNDHMIIAQAISDKIPLISSDHEFKKYILQGLHLVFNKR
jgi:PIN domain nuclease of toxin-antitoxin system